MRYLTIALLLCSCAVAMPAPDGAAPPDVTGTDARPDAAPDVAADTPAPPVDAAPSPDVARDVPADLAAPDVPPTCVDADGDGYGAGCAAGPDCDDGNRDAHPGAAETCDGVDSNCDGVADTDDSAELVRYCVRTQPIATWSQVSPTCHYPGRMAGVWPPVTFPQCFGAGSLGGPPRWFCWRDATRATDCVMPP